jgi:hypothetical protein
MEQYGYYNLSSLASVCSLGEIAKGTDWQHGFFLRWRLRSLTMSRDKLNVFHLMPVSTEALKQDLDGLTHKQIQQVADFVAFLKFRNQRHHRVILDPTQLADLFAEFAEEDCALAEEGMGDYAVMLQQED